jgi:hypothetical protein
MIKAHPKCTSSELTDEFPSLEEPSEYSIIATVSGSLADGSLDLKGEMNPMAR